MRCRLLENELQGSQKRHAKIEKDLRQEIEELRRDNERQQKLIEQVRVPAFQSPSPSLRKVRS